MDRGLIDDTQNFGAKLKSAREQAGFDIETLARRLHIRTDILRTIENCDFENMPASGYTKNMIRAYARSVGINQNEISQEYLRELASFERNETRSKEIEVSKNRSSVKRRSSFLNLTEDSHATQEISEFEALSLEDDSLSSSSRTQNRRRRSSNSNRRERDYYSNAGSRNHVKTKQMQSTYSLGKIPHPSIPNFNSQKLVVAAIVAVIVILLIVIFNLVTGKQSSKVEDDVPTMPISGLTDTSNKDTASTDSAAKTVVDHATFKVEVSSGGESWCTVEIDGEQSLAEVISGPDTKTFEVKGTLEFTTANSEPVKIYINNEEQTMTADTSTGFYVFSYTFDANKANSQ